ncbi:16S rRNA (guanine(527)-N(7))-methyltransferase RsmG [uncultured Thiohalocapsa sp.]|uniref:16S rRNA (guanine(527)-N(7))-methyltransferase RsmG n=1 Tax=uncultured Thiohalocapsa sp. TaxID=768990 RepID=UPI0025F9D24A|nr:16S rRNA (guanine(527)-N(7))-methyltransferase RsmG [uncultured Thiohalocapsa sp.]
MTATKTPPATASAAPARLEAEAGAGLGGQLDAGLAALGVAASATQRKQLLAYVDLLARWNRTYNLTAVREPRDMIPRHLLDSLAVLPWVHRGPVLDVGTGAGLPGMPLAIVRPHLAFTLLDSNGKKIRFVRQAVLELGLDNVIALQARTQAYRPQANFATITARAVTSLDQLCADCAPLLASGGVLLALKGREPTAELDALAKAAPAGARAQAVTVHRLTVPMLDAERCLVEVPFE